MEPLVKGRKIANRYTLLAAVHSSKHSEIWLAQDDSLKSRVVIKTASRKDPVAVQLLENEYNHCSRCVHPNIVRAFECGTDEGLVYLTLEHLSGGSFQPLLGKPPAIFLPPMLQIAEALHHVHQQGIVHRDVKLSNFQLDSRGHARLIDFGVASQRGGEGLRSGGSPRSMSPQQKSGLPPDPGDDMYSFGVALYRVLENKWPDENTGVVSQGDELSDLIDQLMHPDPQQRPVDMATVAERLRFALADQSNVTLPPDEFEFTPTDDEKIDVIPMAARESEATSKAEPQKPRYRLALLLTTYGAIAAAALFFIIPRFVQDGPQTIEATSTTKDNQSRNESGEKSTVNSDSDVEPWQLAQQAKIRKEAEQVLEELLDKQFYLDDQKAHIWAAQDFAMIKEKAIAADKMFRQKKYDEALVLYQEGRDIAESLSDRAQTILPDTLKAADDALGAADAATARLNFALALQIDEKSQRAQRGLTRAENLDKVLALVAEAEKLEQEGQFNDALSLYSDANKLDPEWQSAAAGMKRIQRRQAGVAFSRHMSAGYQALERGDFAEAHNAFERAKAISPGSSEVQEAFVQLETAIRLQDVSSIQSRAQTLENQGDWRGAEREYQAAMAKDGSAASARDGLRRVRDRAEVEEELDALLAAPARLSNDSVYTQAEALQERLQAYQNDAGIASRTSRLTELMAAVRVPVSVRLISDGKTEVLVYRSGRLGTFTSKRLELRPGDYTAVGTRPGYRDARVNFSVAPGESGLQIEVVCRETI